MPPRRFSQLDLNLLRVFDAVQRTGSVRRAAQDLALSPSALSHALARLRATLDDPLFVRKGGRLNPTPFATNIAPEIGDALHRLERALSLREFEPAAIRRRFTIVASTL